MPELTINLIQSDLIWEDPVRNLEHFSGVLDHLSGVADLILLPEMFSTGFSMHPERWAERMDGLSVRFLKDQAKKRNCVICGSLMITENGKYYNRLIWMSPDGSFIHYDKRHLFRLSDESAVFTGGSKKQRIQINGWKVLPLICYDLRFPVWSRNTFSNGEYEYDLLLYVANWPESRSHVWRSLLIARAIENQAYVAGVNRIGKDGNSTNHAGESLVIDPKGRIIAEAGRSEPAILTAKLPFIDLEAFRNSFTVGLDWDQFIIKT